MQGPSTSPVTRLGAVAAGTAAVTYVVAVAVGGWLDPSYSQLSMHVSALTGSHAPNRIVLVPLFVVYNVGIGTLARTLTRQVGTTRALRVAGWLLGLVAVIGVAVVTAFPQDSYGYPATTAGMTHIVLAGIMAPLSVAVLLAAWRGLRAAAATRRLAAVSLLAAVAMLVAGALTVAATMTESTYVGLLQRVTIGALVAWLVALAWHGLRRPGEGA